MAWYVRIGHIPENKSQTGARGYQLYRVGRHVIVRWGKIEAIGRGSTRFRWAHRAQGSRTYKHRTLAAAIQKRQELQAGILATYHRLKGARIMPFRS